MSDTREEKVAKEGGKFVIGLLVYLVTTFIIIGAAGFWWGAHQFSSAGPLQEETLITIERGSGLNRIASKLEEKGAIENRYIFILGSRITGAQADLKAGEYLLEAGISPKDIMIKLKDHDVFGRYITIREGLTSFEVVRLIRNSDELSGDIEDIPAEGSLMPDTYDYRLNEARSAIIERLQNPMRGFLLEACGYLHDAIDTDAIEAMSFKEFSSLTCSPANSNAAVDKHLTTINDVLTLASVVEKETGVSEERARVAGVFLNRLERGIPLQTDPTVIYAITKGEHKNDGKGPLGRRLLRKDLNYDSRYNTYKYPGLPPGPIANPGKASIEAVLNPEKHDYIFFVADGTGGHVFAKTLAEHNRNVAEWRKIRAAQ